MYSAKIPFNYRVASSLFKYFTLNEEGTLVISIFDSDMICYYDSL